MLSRVLYTEVDSDRFLRLDRDAVVDSQDDIDLTEEQFQSLRIDLLRQLDPAGIIPSTEIDSNGLFSSIPYVRTSNAVSRACSEDGDGWERDEALAQMLSDDELSFDDAYSRRAG